MKNSPDSKSSNAGKKVRIIFLHHSTGRNLLRQGLVRQMITETNLLDGTNYELWDHDYNAIGLTDGQGVRTGESFDIPNDNTDPDGLEVLFSQPLHNPADNALSKLMMFDVIIFKSCFPVSAIRNDTQLERYMQNYRVIQETISSNPGRLFIVMTPPPLIPLPLPVIRPRWTNKIDAMRARRFSEWLKSEEFLSGLLNLVTFDFFNLLANPDNQSKDANMLRAEYRSFLGLDSHPNLLANKTVAPLFVESIFEGIKKYNMEH